MNKRQKQVLQSELNNEAIVLERIEKVYAQAVKDCEKKISELSMRTDLENIQSIVYQKQYQQAIKGQLEGILESLHSNEYATISEYITDCYKNGFIGNMYDLAGQGIPLIVPINQEQVVKAVQIDSKLSKPLYDSLGEDINYLKKAVRAQVSRGIANGSTWNEVAATIATQNFQNTPFEKAMNRSKVIARTEGHRVQEESRHDAMISAKRKGADVVKQWCSTLDGRTRWEHQAIDGQIKEVDEAFDIFGMKAMYPSGFGIASQDCNCRCTTLQRAKWALDEEELKTLEDRAKYFGMDKTEDFEDYKKEYLKAEKVVPFDITTAQNAKDYAYGNFTDKDYENFVDEYENNNKNVTLTDEELKLIEDYTEGGYIFLNEVSRLTDDKLLKKGYSEEDIKKWRNKADELDKTLSKYELDEDIVTHRFERDVSWLTGAGNEVEDLEAMIGKEYVEDGFTSSGMFPNRFRFTGGKSDAVHFEIVTPEGTDGALLTMSKKGENEFLYNKGTKYKVLDGGERIVKETKYNIKTKQFEEVDVPERFLKVQVIKDSTIEKNNSFGTMKVDLQLFANKMPDDKFLNYSLNPLKSPDKAEAFEKALGYTVENYESLKQNILDNLVEENFVEKGDEGYGMRYEQILELTGVNGKKAKVLTAWIQDGEDKRLISVYVDKKKAKQ